MTHFPVFLPLAMYESEAKNAQELQREEWIKEAASREKLLKCVIDEQMEHIDKQLGHNEQRQNELEVTKQTHRQAIEGTIERIKDLAVEQHSDDQQVLVEATSTPDTNRNAAKGTAVETVDAIELVDTMKTTEQAMKDVSIGDGFSRPKFGRKKIAWT